MTTSSATSGSSLSSLLGALSGTSTGSSAASGSSSTSGTGSSILSAAGIGSGLDVTSIVNALVAARQAAPQSAITNQTNQLTSQQNGLTQLNSALSQLQASLTSLSLTSTYQSFNAALASTTGGSSIGTATTLSSAQPGSYSVAVSQLATAQSRVSGAVASGQAVGAGNLTISIGSKSMTVAVSATNKLSDIAAAINSSSSNPGVNASIINGVNGQQLILTSQKTGVANAYTVSADSTSSAGLQSVASALNTPGNSEASDAKLTINGIAVDSPSNTVSGVLDGVSLNLTSTGTNQLTVSQDTTAAQTAIQGFVTAYNSYVSTASSLTSYTASSSTAGASSGTAGALLGNATMTAVQNQINAVLSGAVKGNSIGTLSSLGITRQADGTLSVDTDTLNSALTSNPNAVEGLFNSTNGYATTLGNALSTFTATSSGIIPAQLTSIQNSLTQLSTQQTSLNARMAVYQQQLQQQYTNLDTMMSSLNNTSSYLTTALAQLTNSNSKS